MALQFTTSCLQDSITLFRYYKNLAERALAQVTDEELLTPLDADANSIAVIVKHMAGNMRSRWTDFLTSDGEKPNRNRDTEFENPSFENPAAARAAVMELWEQGWQCLLGTLEQLSDADLERKVTIRGEAHSVVQAINRQLAHYPYHCGQIVMLAKHFRGDRWQSLSVPRWQSADFNRRVQSGTASQR